MEKSKSSIKRFYKGHSAKVRLTPRVINIIAQATPWIKGRTVFDVGAGNCFISNCMSVNARSVATIDIEEDVVEFDTLDTHDVVTCFDMLEHIPQKDLTNVLYKLAKWSDDLIIFNQPEQEDKSQPLDNLVEVEVIMRALKSDFKLIYLDNFIVSQNESYNFMVFQKQK